MNSSVSTAAPTGLPHRGLAHWMRRVLKEADRVVHSPNPDAVHDLRVALRRSRSIASGMALMDECSEWRGVRKAGRKLFRWLGKLRDVQVMQEWVAKLSPEGDAVRGALLNELGQREKKLRERSESAIDRFDRKRWKKLMRQVSRRSHLVVPDGPEARQLAESRLAEAMRKHRNALRTQNALDWHALRIGLKRFRYVVENFLPARQATWGEDLKHLQDILGEVQDLEVLRRKLEAWEGLRATEKGRWVRRIKREQATRQAEYREKMTGRNSLWRIWRTGLGVAAPEAPLRDPASTRRRRAAALGSRARGARRAAA